MKKKRNEKRRPTDEEMSRAEDAKLKRYITRSAIEWAEGEPEVRRQMVAQTFGYNLPDQAEKSERKLLAVIDELAIRRIEEDHELAKRITDARIRQVTEEMGLKVEGEERRKKPLTFQDLIRQVREYKELKEEFGVKEPGIFDIFKDPQVITAALQLVPEFFGRKQPPTSDSVFILVEEDGKERVISREEYEQLKPQGNVKHLSDVKEGDPIKQGEGNGSTTEPITSNKNGEGDTETGDAGSGK